MYVIENRQRPHLHFVKFVREEPGEDEVKRPPVEELRIVLGDKDDAERIPEPGSIRRPGDERKLGMPGPVVELTDKEYSSLGPQLHKLLASYAAKRIITIRRGAARQAA